MSESIENPYLAARKTSNDKTADLIDRSRLWQAVALLALMLALAGVGGVIVFASRSQFIPYVIEVDKLGAAAAVRVADRAGNVDERVVRHLLASWISDMRTVTFAK
ncbi:hypothetical protein AGMMS49959_07410 [Planctomycetales bacterium]|nr:hypothetical protein AGMMS49959_07410 [Planctomycetales bacterium]